ncbi:NADPH-dependent ferric siderophore reductase [Pseudomonas sp. A46]|jgi:NADPH-dependent ferric siderophore reductase|nr:siderophore-interacting protein [Pseudomonas sp. A46]OWJ93249.1 NADPH-dependent ferric siderophore reductase [Pseudomonas sp. A46]
MESRRPQRRVQRVRHELCRRDVQVARIEPVGTAFLAVTFTGEALADFVSLGFDDHVKFIFENADGETLMRDYTPRHFDREKRELTLEFALHGDGDASNWAEAATPGQSAIIGGPRGSMVVPVDFEWHLLVGDSSALPAIHRRLEELPAEARVIVVALATEPGERREMSTAAQLDLHWVASNDALIDRLRELPLPSGEGFAWGAGEAATMKRLRGVLVDEKRHPKDAMRVAAYWRQGAAGFHEELTG